MARGNLIGVILLKDCEISYREILKKMKFLKNFKKKKFLTLGNFKTIPPPTKKFRIWVFCGNSPQSGNAI